MGKRQKDWVPPKLKPFSQHSLICPKCTSDVIKAKMRHFWWEDGNDYRLEYLQWNCLSCLAEGYEYTFCADRKETPEEAARTEVEELVS